MNYLNEYFNTLVFLTNYNSVTNTVVMFSIIGVGSVFIVFFMFGRTLLKRLNRRNNSSVENVKWDTLGNTTIGYRLISIIVNGINKNNYFEFEYPYKDKLVISRNIPEDLKEEPFMTVYYLKFNEDLNNYTTISQEYFSMNDLDASLNCFLYRLTRVPADFMSGMGVSNLSLLRQNKKE